MMVNGMTDKYEEFKEWFKKKSHRYGVWKIDDNGNQEIYHYSRAFMDFEEEQSKNDKKEKFDDIMCHWLNKSMTNPRMFNLNELFDELKEKDLIK